MNRAVVINVVGLTRSLIGDATPRLREFLSASADIRAIAPAVTCSAQSTYLTGRLPREHGIVGNGWYFRDLGEVFFWRQSNRLVQGDKIWHEGKRRNPEFTCANSFWWYNMNTDADYSVTPRPLYLANGLKLPDCASDPPELRERFNREFGTFPLFKFWGPATSIEASDWIARAAMAIEEAHSPTLQLVYLPHLDYVLQREGPRGNIARDLAEIDTLCGKLLDFFRSRGLRVILLSEYGITPVSRHVHPNRILREAGLLGVKVDLGREYLDTFKSRAFAVSDHQVAHVYIRNAADISAIKKLFTGVPGVERVLDEDGKREFGLDHERSGELVLVSDADCWFTYYFWLDDAKAPDYARTVDIHRKPGYDPCELFLDPEMKFPKLKIGATLMRKILGFRYMMDVIPLDASLVKGSHGHVTDNDADGPIFMTTEPKFLSGGRMESVDVYGAILDHVFRD
ncbi:MAG: alkaline phosphatase family protein [Nitrospirae bacterium]|nr:alkaline phosphatase family protein [Nitrospirota bacterium]